MAADKVQRLVSVEVLRETPLDLLADLRQVVENVELVHVNGNRWWLGVVRPSKAQKFGLSPLAAHTAGEHLRRTLQQQGFRWLGEYTDEQLSSSYLTNELNYMFGRTEDEIEAEVAAGEAVADGTARAAATDAIIRDKIESDGPSLFAKFMRKRRTLFLNSQREWDAEKAARAQGIAS